MKSIKIILSYYKNPKVIGVVTHNKELASLINNILSAYGVDYGDLDRIVKELRESNSYPMIDGSGHIYVKKSGGLLIEPMYGEKYETVKFNISDVVNILIYIKELLEKITNNILYGKKLHSELSKLKVGQSVIFDTLTKRSYPYCGQMDYDGRTKVSHIEVLRKHNNSIPDISQLIYEIGYFQFGETRQCSVQLLHTFFTQEFAATNFGSLLLTQNFSIEDILKGIQMLKDNRWELFGREIDISETTSGYLKFTWKNCNRVDICNITKQQYLDIFDQKLKLLKEYAKRPVLFSKNSPRFYCVGDEKLLKYHELLENQEQVFVSKEIQVAKTPLASVQSDLDNMLLLRTWGEDKNYNLQIITTDPLLKLKELISTLNLYHSDTLNQLKKILRKNKGQVAGITILSKINEPVKYCQYLQIVTANITWSCLIEFMEFYHEEVQQVERCIKGQEIAWHGIALKEKKDHVIYFRINEDKTYSKKEYYGLMGYALPGPK